MEREIRRRRGPGAAVDHEAIHRARLAAGLSLSDVAGTEMSRATVHRIERGLARPSMATLRLIAERLGATADEFLLGGGTRAGRRVTDEESLILARLERLCQEARHAEVLSAIDELQHGSFGPSAEARLHLFAAIAHICLQQPALGLLRLDRARSTFAELQDEWQVIECMGWEAAALNIQEDSSALEVALAALRRCREVEGVPPPTITRILALLASIYRSRHEWEPAIDAYRAALAASEPVRELAAMTRSYEGMSLAYMGLGDLSQAATYAQRAVGLSSVVANTVSVARLENNLGVLMLRMGQHDEAEHHLQRADDLCDAAGIEHGRSHVLLGLAQLAYAREDFERAEAHVRRTIALSAGIGERATCSLGHQWLGKILAAHGRTEESEAAFQTALATLADLGAVRRLAACHQAFAEVLERRGELDRAVVHWREAATMRTPPGEGAEGQDWIEPSDLAT